MGALMNKTLKFNSSEQNIFFTADPHFGHANVINYCNRPFVDVYEMNQVLVQNWNRVVSKKDIVFVIGDFALASSETIYHVFKSLNGHKNLIIGNHDKNFNKQPWELIDKMTNLLIEDPEIKDGQRITLCHYPMLSWYQSHRGSWQLFGHVHGGLSNKEGTRTVPTQLDVGVDVHNFTPISYQEVKTIITKQSLK